MSESVEFGGERLRGLLGWREARGDSERARERERGESASRRWDTDQLTATGFGRGGVCRVFAGGAAGARGHPRCRGRFVQGDMVGIEARGLVF